ncbi:putative isomerase YraM [Mycena sanguinolenta]|uniref:Putative isomerase YraM n=1 Tax=Mycena sanguinolenta TaxID=230812 RepID=A0A8H6Z6E5_9AGAR|nr:putative isomerase YraM [Mycena sanguinolenta]
MQNPIPATFLRGGTSKGIFIHKDHLPSDRDEWPRIFLGIMGSPDKDHGRQLNGMGGGVSSLSKICVVAPASPEKQAQGIAIEYTFVQVGVRDSSIDYSGNCGNLSSMIGVFARDEGMCPPPPPGARHHTVRSFNTNTQKIIDTTFPVVDSVAALDLPEASIAGVPGKASTIVMEFVRPAGARTGKLLPSGVSVDQVEISISPNETRHLRASYVDATNPTVFVTSAELSEFLSFDEYVAGSSSAAAARVSDVLELIRQRGAERMGLDPSAQAQPKIAVLSAPDKGDLEQDVDIVVHALSMGVLHRAVPGTVGLCLGVAANVHGTLAWEIAQKSRGTSGKSLNEPMVRIKHPSGLVDVGAEFGDDGTAKSAKMVRTGRRLMKGVVWW